MVKKTLQQQEWALASIALQDACTDFFLSRQAMLCTKATLEWYGFTVGQFTNWLQANGVTNANEIMARHVRAYLGELAQRELSDNYIHGHARSVKTFLRFCHAEGYIDQPVKFAMPQLGKKRLPVLSAGELRKLIDACNTPRDLVVVMFLADSGARRAELLALNWADVDLQNGLVRIARGKGRKSRSVIVGAKTRRALLKYRRTVIHKDNAPLIQTRSGTRLKASGLRSMLKRLGERAGVKVTPHALRRTFATLSTRAGMGLLELQALLGHASIEMTRKYVQTLDEDLLTAHRQHGPVDRWTK